MNKKIEVIIVVIAGLLLPLYAQNANAIDESQIVEHRYCGQPKRNSNGVIIRSGAVKKAFAASVPCPDKSITGACDGWQIDHVWPLDSCGCDSVTNMQWLKVEIKTCAGTICKDRWERSVYKCKPEDALVK